MYLLDTDILSNLLKPVPSSALIVRMARVPPEQQFTSSITFGEMLYGAYKRPDRTTLLLQRFQASVLPHFEVLPFDTAAAWRYGEVRALLEQRGTVVADADLRIASIALARELTMVTGNVRHFRYVPNLTIDNWLE
jgi:predicted nucleic acid-binding protein